MLNQQQLHIRQLKVSNKTHETNWNRTCTKGKKNSSKTVLCTVLSYCGVVYLLYMLYFKMSCVYCCQLSCVYYCSCLVCIIVVVLCVLLSSYVYLLYYVSIDVFYFRFWTAGLKSVFGRSCDRPPRHRFFLVSLCL